MVAPLVLFWWLIIGLAVWALARRQPAPVTAGGAECRDAREVVRRRYAKGEITKEEFTQLMKDLD